MARLRRSHRIPGSTHEGAVGGSAAVGQFVFGRDARVPARSCIDHRAMASEASRTPARRDLAPSAPEMLVAELSA